MRIDFSAAKMDDKKCFAGKWLSATLLVILLTSNAQSEELHGAGHPRAPTDENDGHLVPVAPLTQRSEYSAVPAAQPAREQQRQLQKRSISIRLRDLQKFISQLIDNVAENDESSNGRAMSTNLLFNDKVIERIRGFVESYFDGSAAGAAQSNGRVFLFKGETGSWES